MKTNKHKSIRLSSAIAAVLVAVSAFFAYAATVNDLTAITGTAELMFTDQTAEYSKNTIYNTYFLIGSQNKITPDKGTYTFGSETYCGSGMNNRQVYFKIAVDHTADVTIYLNIDKIGKYIRLKDNDGNDVATSTSTATGTEIITKTGLAAGTYYVMGDDNNAVLCGIKVNAKAASTEPTFATITKDYTWRVSKDDKLTGTTGENKGFNYPVSATSKEFYFKYTGTTDVPASLPTQNNGPAIDEKNRNWGFILGNSQYLGFKVGKGKGTLTFYVGGYSNFTLSKGENYADAMTVTSKLERKDGPTIDGLWCITDKYTYEFDNSTPETYWINISNSSGYDALILAGIDVTFSEVAPEEPNLKAIAEDFTWYSANDVNVTPGNNNATGSQYYTYYTGSGNAGKTATNDVWHQGGGSIAYTLNGKLGFKVAAGKKYVINLYTSRDATCQLESDNGAGSVTVVNATTSKEVKTDDNSASGIFSTYVVNDASDETTYWINMTSGSLAGFDVMFDNSSVAGAANVTPLTGSGTWTPADDAKTDLLNANGLGTVSVYESGKCTSFYNLGKTAVLDGEYTNCVSLADGRAIGFKLPANVHGIIKVATKGSGNFKIVQGADPASATDVTTATAGTANPYKFTVTTSAENPLWIVGDATAYLESVTYDIRPKAESLATISDDFTWYSSNETVEAGNNSPAGDGTYYIYTTGVGEAGMTPNADVWLHGGPTMAYTLDGKLGFKVKAGKYVITLYTSQDAPVTLTSGESTSTTEVAAKASKNVSGNGATGTVKTYVVDASADTKYWIGMTSGSLAGFDVMFDTSSKEGVSGTTAITSSGTWTPADEKATINNTNGLGTLDIYKSGNATKFYNLGASAVLEGEYNGCVSLDNGRAIGLRIGAGYECSAITVTANGTGSYTVVEGADPATGTAVTFPVTATEDKILWIKGSADDFYIQKVEYTIKRAASAGPLTAIKNYYLWRATSGENVDANAYFDNNYLRHNTNGSATALTPDATTNVRVLGVETPTVALDGTNEITLKLAAGTKGKVNIYYTGTDPVVKTDGDEKTLSDGSAVTTAAGEVEGAKVATYSFDLSADQLVHIQGNGTKIAAIEVVTDKNIAATADKNIDWYVCGDTKMIAGSERVDGNTEYAEFYVSKGRKPRVSFFMPSILKVFYQEKNGDPDSKYKVTINNGGSKKTLTMPKLYSGDKMIDTSKGDIWQWMTQDVEVNPKSDNTQTVRLEATDLDDAEKTRTWNVELKFHFIDCPTITVKDNSTTATLTMKAAKGYESFPVYYTIDSTDPANLANTTVVTDETEGYYSTAKYEGEVDVKVNCIALAAQYVTTEKPFYTDGPGSQTSSVFKLLSEQKYIMLADREDIIYVNDPSKGSAFARTAGDIDVLEIGGIPALRFMYGRGTGSVANAVKFFRTVDNDNTFQLGAVKWGGTKDDQDGGYDTYMDPYQYTLAGGEPGKVTVDGSEVKFNANPNTEMNGGIGGANTEDGGMFLQPVGGDFFRLEPEYDGVATVWVRQNGMVDYGNMYNGEISRRPVYVVDEDGVVQRGSTIKPTNLHHLAVNGVYATASGRNELRASFANAWKYATLYDEGWNILHNRIKRADSYFPMTYELMQIWFGDIVKFTTTGTDNYVIKSGKPSAAPITIERGASANINRYSRIGTQLLYRDDWMYSQEQELHKKYPNASANPFAKYGYEIPNFGYVQYRIPVKAGKTYYMGGRGTKNGFVAMQFEPMPPNYDNKAYQRIDNPTIIDGRGESRATLSWPKKEPDVKLDYVATAAVAEYDDESKVPTLTIDENDGNNQWWTWQDKNERPNMLSGKTINVKLVRNFEAGKWYPIVLPFSVSESRLREMFGDDVKVLYLDPLENSFSGDTDRKFNSVYHPAIEDTQLKFTYHYYQMLYANTPAFICPSKITDDTNLKTTENGKTVFHFRRVCFKGGDIKTYAIGDGYEVTGSYVPTYKSTDNGNTGNGEMYYISNEDGKVVMYHSRNGIDMKGTRCWIRPTKTEASRAPIMTMGFGSFSADGFDDDSGTTGITDVISDEAPATLYDNDNVYDIMGRVVATGSTAGLPSGIYIFKGKKVYVK